MTAFSVGLEGKKPEYVVKKLFEKIVKDFLDLIILAKLHEEPAGLSGYDLISYIQVRYGFLISSGKYDEAVFSGVTYHYYRKPKRFSGLQNQVHKSENPNDRFLCTKSGDISRQPSSFSLVLCCIYVFLVSHACRDKLALEVVA